MATLHFKGKSAVWNHHLSVPYQTLDPVTKMSHKGKGEEENLIVEGDNLTALKSLLPQYRGRIKCIYIDPPYNTGEEKWVYNDNINNPIIKSWIGKVVGKEGEDLTRHDKWLCMMTPRLKLLKELLSDDGVIFVSIDDVEAQYLRLLLNEIFGDENHIASFIWEGGMKNDSKYISDSHDYIFGYSKDFQLMKLKNKKWRIQKEGLEEIYEKAEMFVEESGNDYEKASALLNTWYKDIGKKHPAYRNRHYNKIDEKGVFFPSDISWPGGGGPKFEVLHPETKKPVRVPSRGWMYSTIDALNKAAKEDEIYFGPDENKVPTYKRYLSNTEGQVLSSIFYKDRRASTKSLRELFDGKDLFENPKDVNVLMDLIDVVTDDNDIVLDSFAGSGSTAQAVLELNKEDGGNRKFILVQIPEETGKESDAHKAGYKTVQEITQARVKKVIKRDGLDTGFTYYKLGQQIDADGILSGDLPSYDDFAKYVYYLATGKNYPAKSKVDTKKYFVGKDEATAVFLVYENDFEKLKSMALTLDLAKDLHKQHEGRKIVYAPACFLDEHHLDQFNITFVGIPFNLFERN